MPLRKPHARAARRATRRKVVSPHTVAPEPGHAPPTRPPKAGLTGGIEMRSVLLLLLRGYKLVISPWLGNRCRFHPSCSDYAREAIVEHGAGYGTYLAAKRLCRCHPFHPGGFDPVPPARHARPAPDSSAEGTDKAASSDSSRAERSVSSRPAAASAVTRRAPSHS